ncbi:MAG: TRAP transporter large permease subunit [Ignavibacteriales bacterium]|nr:TRAP transporter large permease subunit [Ignavibacteriales bacterium]
MRCVPLVDGALAGPIIVLLVAAAVLGAADLRRPRAASATCSSPRPASRWRSSPTRPTRVLTGHAIPAIPLFAVAGFILSESKAGERMVRFFKAVFGWFPGGLAIMAVLVCAFFTTFTGASGVTILRRGRAAGRTSWSEGRLREAVQLRTADGGRAASACSFPEPAGHHLRGDRPGRASRTCSSAGSLPGVVPGRLGHGRSACSVRGSNGVPRERFVAREAVAAVRDSFWEILLPRDHRSASTSAGITTPGGERGRRRALRRDRRDLHPPGHQDRANCPASCSSAVPIIGGVLTILALANGLSYYIVDAEIPMQLTAWVAGADLARSTSSCCCSTWPCSIVGCFMDIFSAILVVVPLIIPLGQIFGIHPVHLGIIFLANLELGYLTPPVGLNLYLASYRVQRADRPGVQGRAAVFLALGLAAVLLITYVPLLTTALL